MKSTPLIQILTLFLFLFITACGTSPGLLTNDAITQENDSSVFDDSTDSYDSDQDIIDSTTIGNPPYDENNPDENNIDQQETEDEIPVDCNPADSDDDEDCGEPDHPIDNNDRTTISLDMKKAAVTITGSLEINIKDFRNSVCLNNLESESTLLILFESILSTNQKYSTNIDFVNMFKVNILSNTAYNVYFAKNTDEGITICGIVVSSNDTGMLEPLIIKSGDDNIDLGNIRYIGGNHYLTEYNVSEQMIDREDLNELIHDERNP